MSVQMSEMTDDLSVGGMALAAGTQGMFRTRCSAANTAVTYALT